MHREEYAFIQSEIDNEDVPLRERRISNWARISSCIVVVFRLNTIPTTTEITDPLITPPINAPFS
jgi:hypothetical protein